MQKVINLPITEDEVIQLVKNEADRMNPIKTGEMVQEIIATSTEDRTAPVTPADRILWIARAAYLEGLYKGLIVVCQGVQELSGEG